MLSQLQLCILKKTAICAQNPTNFFKTNDLIFFFLSVISLSLVGTRERAAAFKVVTSPGMSVFSLDVIDHKRTEQKSIDLSQNVWLSS